MTYNDQTVTSQCTNVTKYLKSRWDTWYKSTVCFKCIILLKRLNLSAKEREGKLWFRVYPPGSRKTNSRQRNNAKSQPHISVKKSGSSVQKKKKINGSPLPSRRIEQKQNKKWDKLKVTQP